MWPSVLAHAIPLEPGEGGHQNLVITLTTLGVLSATLIGLWIGNLAQRRLALPAAAFAAGALLLLAHDLLKESATLGQGILQNPLLVGTLLLAFAGGMLLLPTAKPRDATRIAWLWTIGIALHTAGEGLVLGSEANTADLTGVLGIASFLLHKLLEAATIPLVANAALANRTTIATSGTLAAVALASTIMGATRSSGNLTLILFAAGAGATLYAILLLANRAPMTLRHTAYALAGFLTIYAAGLLHET